MTAQPDFANIFEDEEHKFLNRIETEESQDIFDPIHMMENTLGNISMIPA
jgi:hypothetical protein